MTEFAIGLIVGIALGFLAGSLAVIAWLYHVVTRWWKKT